MAQDLDLSWFDLSKYDDVSKFTLRDWHTELSRRVGFRIRGGRLFNVQYLHDELYPVINDSEHNNKEVDDRFKATFYEGLKTEPILKETSYHPAMFHNGLLGHDGVSEAVMHACWNDVSLDLVDIVFLTDLIASIERVNSVVSDGDRMSGEEEYDGLNDSEFLDAYHELEMLKEEPVKHNHDFTSLGARLVSINFDAPTEILMKKFKAFVKEIKVERGEALISDVKRETWADMMVLPCIDLLICSEVEGKRIVWNEMDELLFPIGRCNGSSYVVDQARRSVFRLAEKILHPRTIALIEYRLDYEMNAEK